MFPDRKTAYTRRLLEYERKQLKDFSASILQDDGVPNLVKVINEVKERMRSFRQRLQEEDPFEIARKARFIPDHEISEANLSESDG